MINPSERIYLWYHEQIYRTKNEYKEMLDWARIKMMQYETETIRKEGVILGLKSQIQEYQETSSTQSKEIRKLYAEIETLKSNLKHERKVNRNNQKRSK